MSIYSIVRDTPRKQPARPFGTQGDKNSGQSADSLDDNSLVAGLTKFFPAEIITIYISGLAFVPLIAKDITSFNNTLVYFICILLTPIFAAGLNWYYSVKIGSVLSKPLLIWRIFCATLAFSVWGLAIPNNPLINSEGLKALVAFVALVLSLILNLFESIINIRTKHGT